MSSSNHTGQAIYDLAAKLFPIGRSLTGHGNRQTLKILAEEMPGLTIHEVPSGTKALDWTVPDEWNIKDAYVQAPNGEKIIDFRKTNLSVVGYSLPIHKTVSRAELDLHLHSLENQPDAIPYVTSYYEPTWGFCLTHEKRKSLPDGDYKVVIDSELKPGSLTFGELLIPGASSKEIFISTYICHPSMGNNELSGPTVATFLAKWLRQAKRRYSYRFVFIPETIGSIVYLSKNLETLKKNVFAGFNISCVGDDRAYSYLPSRAENTISDRVALHVLRHLAPDFKRYSYSARGSDERQYCSPGADLPIASVMRTKYGDYPEYHTSKDDMSLISPQGLFGGYEALRRCLEILESNGSYKTTVIGEPQLGKRGLYPNLSIKGSAEGIQNMLDVLAYSDGTLDLLGIADKIGVNIFELFPVVETLLEEELLAKI